LPLLLNSHIAIILYIFTEFATATSRHIESANWTKLYAPDYDSMRDNDLDKLQAGDRIHNGDEQKGKAKEAPASSAAAQSGSASADGSSENAQATDVSTLSRLTSSTLALGSSLVSAPDVGALGGSTSKAGSGSNTRLGTTALAETSHPRLQTSAGPSGSIRSAQVQDHIQREEAAFSQFLEGVDSSAVSGIAPEDVSSRLVIDHTNHEATSVQSQPGAGQHQFAENDGLDVVKLLDQGYDEVMMMDPVVPLSKDQELRLKQALFGAGSSADDGGKHATDWSNILNFVPEYVSNGSSGWGYRELSGHMGTSDTMQASEIWADQWGDVLSRYTDEVWGDLGSLVQEAREEAKKIQSREGEASPAEAKAILRLRQILSHIRDSR
jgi:hypothetical protein